MKKVLICLLLVAVVAGTVCVAGCTGTPEEIPHFTNIYAHEEDDGTTYLYWFDDDTLVRYFESSDPSAGIANISWNGSVSPAGDGTYAGRFATMETTFSGTDTPRIDMAEDYRITLTVIDEDTVLVETMVNGYVNEPVEMKKL